MSNTAEVTDMTQLAIDQVHAQIEKALAETRKFSSETAKLMEMLPAELEKVKAEAEKATAEAAKARAENQRLLEMLPHEIKKAEKEARWYGWVGASGFIALAIVFLMVLGKVLPGVLPGGHP